MNQKQAKELVRSRLSDKRYEHTLNVKKMAVKLAKRYGVDEDKAALAALLHDSAKEISKDEMRELMRQYPQYAEGGEERPNPVWHGICAAILARTQWGVEDEAILSAIACHTAGKAGMSRPTISSSPRASRWTPSLLPPMKTSWPVRRKNDDCESWGRMVY